MSSRCEEDVAKLVGTPCDNGVCTDVYESTPVLSNEGYVAIRQQILQDEHLRVALACDIIAASGIPRRSLHCLRTDAVIVQSTRKQAKRLKKLCRK